MFLLHKELITLEPNQIKPILDFTWKSWRLCSSLRIPLELKTLLDMTATFENNRWVQKPYRLLTFSKSRYGIVHPVATCLHYPTEYGSKIIKIYPHGVVLDGTNFYASGTLKEIETFLKEKKPEKYQIWPKVREAIEELQKGLLA